ncbi:MAG: hypothetical protein IJQ02_01660 [Oscillospiraceae bacterium]|nr:hypothetical protein [Oscillospiraceae bacterium]
MMTSDVVPGKLPISILGKENGILIGRNVILKLGVPNCICILKGTDKESIAIVPCAEKQPLSFKVPEDFIGARNRKMRIYSQAFVQELLTANGLDPAKTHRIYGAYSEEYNAAIFPLKVL